MNGPLQRIQIIEASRRCARLGLISVIPIFGVLCALRVIQEYSRIARLAGKEWNPGRRCLILGYAMAWFGFSITVAMLGLVALISLVQIWAGA